MKNYLLIFALLLMFGLLIAGCGNRTPQSSNDEILDDVTQNLNVEKINNTLDSILCRCSEEAKLRYYQDYHHRSFNLAIADYDDEFIAFVDTMESIYQPYKKRLVATITNLSVEDCAYDPNLSLEFAQDILWLNNSAFFLERTATGRYEIGVCAKYHYVRLRQLIDKYYDYLLKNANSNVRISLPKIHKQWLDLLVEDIKMSAQLDEYRWLTLQNIFDMMKQRLLFYYNCTQSNTLDG